MEKKQIEFKYFNINDVLWSILIGFMVMLFINHFGDFSKKNLHIDLYPDQYSVYTTPFGSNVYYPDSKYPFRNLLTDFENYDSKVVFYAIGTFKDYPYVIILTILIFGFTILNRKYEFKFRK